MKEVYEIYVKSHFSAAHRLIGYEGDCSRVHGHNWMVEVFVISNKLDEIGIAIDFRVIKQEVRAVIDKMDHHNLNDLEFFSQTNPTSENVAKFLYKELSNLLNRNCLRIHKVKVSESSGAGASYWEE